MIKKIFDFLKKTLRNHLDTILIVALIVEAVYLGYLIYEEKNQPQYLMTMPVDCWYMLNAQQQDVIVSTLFAYSKTINSDWENRVLYFYENKNMFKILFVRGRVETRRSLETRPETPKKGESANI